MPLRVLVCTQGFPRDDLDPHATFVGAHAAAVASTGAAVSVLCPSAPNLPAHDVVHGLPVHRFRYAPRRFETLAYTGAMHRRARGPAALLLVPFLLGFLVEATRRARAADVLHAHWWLPSGLVAVVAGALAGVPVVITIHGTDAALARGPLRPLGRWVLRRADVVEAVSTDLARWCADLAGVEARVAPMPLGAAVAPSSAPRLDGPVLAVGRLVPEKGFDVAIAAVARTGDVLELVGDGDQRRQLEELARTTGADVRFLGALAPEDVAARYRGARLVVVPSRREGFGMVAAEAAASGRAVIASAVGGLPDIVSAANGVLVPADDIDALEHALRATDPALGSAGPAQVAHLTPASIGTRALATYLAVVPSGRRALLRPIVRWSAGILAVVAVAFAVRSLADAFRDASSLEIDWSVAPIATSVGCALTAGLILSASWTALVRAGDPSVTWRGGARVWWLGQLGRYLPTGLGALPARVALARRAGYASRPALVASAVEAAALPVACLILWLATVAGPYGPVGAVMVAGAWIAGVRRAGLPWAVAVAYVAMILGQLMLRVVGLGALFALASVDTPGFGALVGAVGSAYLLGLLAVFAPGGVGVREVLLATALTPTAGVAAATAAAVTWRLVESLVELVLLGVTRLDRTARSTGDAGNV